MIDYLKSQPLGNIIKACNDIYDWKYETGTLPENSIIHDMAKETGWKEIELEEEVAYYALAILTKTVKLLLAKYMWAFLRR